MVLAPAVGLKSILKKKISSIILAEKEGSVAGLMLNKNKEECFGKEGVNEKNEEVSSSRNRGHTLSVKRGRCLTEDHGDLVELEPDLAGRKKERMEDSQGSSYSLQRMQQEEREKARLVEPVGGSGVGGLDGLKRPKTC